MSLPDRGLYARTISIASDSGFRSDANVPDTAANARGDVNDESDNLSGTASGLSDSLSGPATYKAAVLAAMSVAVPLCPVNV